MRAVGGREANVLGGRIRIAAGNNEEGLLDEHVLELPEHVLADVPVDVPNQPEHDQDRQAEQQEPERGPHRGSRLPVASL